MAIMAGLNPEEKLSRSFTKSKCKNMNDFYERADGYIAREEEDQEIARRKRDNIESNRACGHAG